MTSLDQAWEWYKAAKESAKIVHRLATKHWETLPTDSVLDAGQHVLIRNSSLVNDPLDDLAVLVLFSVFEAAVRTHLLEDIESEAQVLAHPVLKAAADEAKERIEVGSFFRVFEPLKTPKLHALIEQVNQVRRYRNWVAHGRREERRPDNVDPQTAYDRLTAFLLAIDHTN
jgi:hypothetical protein